MLNLTPALHAYKKFRNLTLTKKSPTELQENELLKLLRTASSTRFGKEHRFSKIATVEEFQKHVPLRKYEDFWNDYWKPHFPYISNQTWPGTVPYFPVSSGTTSGTTKYIPYSAAMQRSNTKAGLDLLVHHLNNRPQSRLFAGKNFILGGSTELVEEYPGIFSGDLSGIAVKTLPWWARPRYFPPQELALIKDWEEKIDVLAERSLRESITMISGVPAWLLLFFNRLFQLRPEAKGQLSTVFPELEMLVHGGVNFQPYRQQFEQLLAGSSAEMREVYPASEGFIAIADKAYGDGLRLNLDHGIFFEFVPLDELHTSNPTRHWIDTVEPGVNYALVMSTCAGLWSYVIGDTVRFVDTKAARVLVTGRTSYYLSAFGEHLIEDEIQDALATAANHTGLTFHDFSVGAVFPSSPDELGGHLYIVEFDSGFPAHELLEDFSKALDSRLCQRNEDYQAHRANGFGLKKPEILAVPQDTFSHWMKARGKLGGQHKVPRLISDPELFSHLTAYSQQELVRTTI
jgi:hypothetical protein